MENTIEIELRYKIVDQGQVSSFLTRARQLHKRHDIDVYLDTPGRTLWKQGIYIRIRNDKTLDIKFNRSCLQNPTIGRLDHCEEHSFLLPLETSKMQALNELLASLNLKALPFADLNTFKSINSLETFYVIDKIRTSYTYNAFTIVVDEVTGLGMFLEIELMTHNTDDLERVKNEMKHALAGLQLEPLKVGYGELIVRNNDFNAYLQGRFVLDEDKNCL